MAKQLNRLLDAYQLLQNTQQDIVLTVRRQMIWHKSSKKLRETFIYYSSVLLVHT